MRAFELFVLTGEGIVGKTLMLKVINAKRASVVAKRAVSRKIAESKLSRMGIHVAANAFTRSTPIARTPASTAVFVRRLMARIA